MELDQAIIAAREARFRNLSFFSHLQVNYNVLDQFGLHEAGQILTRGEWKVLRPTEPTYKALTKEFLCTVWQPNPDIASIAFRMRDRWYEMSYERLNGVFGTPNDGMTAPVGGHAAFWASIRADGSGWSPSVSRNSQIDRPSTRLLQYVISRTIFARAESAEKLTAQDLTVLWGLLHNMGVNVANLWVQLLLIRVNRNAPGRITVGPYVTMIAKAVRALRSTRDLEEPDATWYMTLTEGKLRRWGFVTAAEQQAAQQEADDDDVDFEIDNYSAGEESSEEEAEAGPSRRRDRGTWDMDQLNDRLTRIENNQTAWRADWDAWRTQDDLRWGRMDEFMSRFNNRGNDGAGDQ